jgi:hypothetical protein
MFIIAKPFNLTFTNSLFYETYWDFEGYGIVTGYADVVLRCTESKQYFTDIFENNTFFYSVPTQSNLPFQVWLDT